MTVGFPVAKLDIDSTVGQICLQLRDSISRVPVIQGRINAMSDADLQALGYSVDDITLLKAVITDLVALQQIAFGQGVLPNAYDFRTNVSKVTGIA